MASEKTHGEQGELALFTDLYELTMLQAYMEQDMTDSAVFSLFYRRLPSRVEGACFHPDLEPLDSAIVVTKGVRFDQDQNSAFDQTGLAVQLKADGIDRLWVAGLAKDVCILTTVLDARKEGFDTRVIREGTRSITPEGGEKAREQIRDSGAQIVG